MLQAFKSHDGVLIPFASIAQAYKVDFRHTRILTMGGGRESFCFNSVEDRDQQFANFEKWLTIKTNSI